jgi:hypothetical protein
MPLRLPQLGASVGEQYPPLPQSASTLQFDGTHVFPARP